MGFNESGCVCGGGVQMCWWREFEQVFFFFFLMPVIFRQRLPSVVTNIRLEKHHWGYNKVLHTSSVIFIIDIITVIKSVCFNFSVK